MAMTRTESGIRPAPFFDQGLFLLALNRGKEEMRRAQYEQARREFEKAQKFRPHDPEVLSNLSFTLFHLGMLEESERMTRSLLASHSESVPLLFNLGLILFKSGRDAEAKDPLRRVIELAPNHRKAHLTLGLVFQRLGDVPAARKHFKLAGAESRSGGELDDTVSRSARAAAAVTKSGVFAKPEVPAAPSPAPVVKPEPLESLPPEAAVTAPISLPAATAPPVPASQPGPAEPPGSAEPPGAPAPPAMVSDAPSPPIVEAQVPAGALTFPVAAPTPPLRLGPFSSRSGFLSADVREGLLTRRGVLMGRAGDTTFEEDRLLRGALGRLLVRVEGEGTLLLVDRGRRPFLLSLDTEFLSIEPARLLAFTESLLYREDPAFELRRAINLPFLKLFGSGVVALSVMSEPARFDVSVEQPLTIAARTVLAYGGDLVPELLEERDPLADFGSGPVLRFAGEGYVLAD